MVTPPLESAAPVGLTVAAVARRLGVAPATLRTWDRRYGLGPTEHSAGAHRRYSAVDVARLDLVRRLVNSGVGPGDAARAALDADLSPQGLGDLVTPFASPSASFDLDAAFERGSQSEVELAAVRAESSDAGVSVRGLRSAASALDSITCTGLVREALERRGVGWTWDSLLVPVLSGVGTQWAETGRGIEVEHLLSESVLAALNGVVARLRQPVNPRPVLLACAPDEMHSLPLFAVAAGLAERHVSTRVLGARVPSEALVAAIRRTGPSALLLWSQQPDTGAATLLDALPSMRPAPVVLVGGAGWDHPLPDQVAQVHHLDEAVTMLARAAVA